jgi:hypothetical protein
VYDHGPRVLFFHGCDLVASIDTAERALRGLHRAARSGRWDDQPGYGEARTRTALTEAPMLAELLTAALDRAREAAVALSAEASLYRAPDEKASA